MDFLIVIFLVLFVVFMLASWLMPWFFAHKAKGKDVQALQHQLGLDDRRHLVYFWSPSCGHCKAMTVVINELMDKHDNVHTVNLVDQAALAKELGVMGTPALAIIDKGRVAEVQLGARTGAQIERLLSDKA